MEDRLQHQIEKTNTAESRLREQVEISTNIQSRLDEQIELTSNAERKLEQNLELAAAIANSLGEGVYAFDLEGRITYVNPAAERMLGWSIQELMATVRPALTKSFVALLVEHGNVVHRDEETFTRRDGSVFPASITCSPVRLQGRMNGGVVAFRDITEVKESQEALRRVDKLASAGRMAAAMAHEINNPLQAVTNLHLLIKGQDLPLEAREFLCLAEKELRRIAHITQQHLHFYRESSKPVAVDIGQIIEEVVAIRQIQHSWPSVHLLCEQRASATVLGFPGEMRQLFANLLANCVEAGSTRIRIRVTAACSSKNDAKRQYIRVTVADNASGIPLSCRARIFEPFFTTKGEKGSGLGLWVCRGIVARHDGSIRFRTSTHAVDHGTAISVCFPSLSLRRLPKASAICA